MDYKKVTTHAISTTFGILVIIDGLLNLFRGNDPGLGVFFILLSTIYFEPTNKLIHSLLGFRIHYIIKIVVALFIIWVTLAVGAINEGYYPEILDTTPQ